LFGFALIDHKEGSSKLNLLIHKKIELMSPKLSSCWQLWRRKCMGAVTFCHVSVGV